MSIVFSVLNSTFRSSITNFMQAGLGGKKYLRKNVAMEIFMDSSLGTFFM